MQTVTLKLPLSTLALLHRLAEEEDVSLGQIVRDATDREIRRRTLAKATTPRRRKPLALWRVVSQGDLGDDPDPPAPAALPRFGTKRISRAS